MQSNGRLAATLDLLKQYGPISAAEIGKRLSFSEKQARGAIDSLRKLGEPVWNDSGRQAFWWDDQWPIGDGWKRSYSAPLNGTRNLRPATHISLEAPRLHRSGVADLKIEGRQVRPPPISPQTWQNLIAVGAEAQWSRPGVFATAEGLRFQRGGRRTLLYVGKSLGALGENLNLGLNLTENAEKAQYWMENWRIKNPRSSFWQVGSKLAPVEELAWTNIFKIDVPTTLDHRRGKPPGIRQSAAVAGPSIDALAEEVGQLSPHVTLFVTWPYGREVVEAALESCSYTPYRGGDPTKSELKAALWRSDDNRWAVQVRHPQGTSTEWRNHLVGLVNYLWEAE